MGAQGQSTLRSPRWAEQGQLLPVWRSKRKSHSYGHYSRFTLNRLYFLVTSWSLLCSGSIVQLAKCEFLFLIKSESWKSFLETICCQLGLIDVLGYWCQLDYASWLQAPRFLFFLIEFSTVYWNAIFSCWASICDWCWMGSNWSLCCDLCFSLDSIEW